MKGILLHLLGNGGLLNPRLGVLISLRSNDYYSAASLCRLLLRNFQIPPLSAKETKCFVTEKQKLAEKVIKIIHRHLHN